MDKGEDVPLVEFLRFTVEAENERNAKKIMNSVDVSQAHIPVVIF